MKKLLLALLMPLALLLLAGIARAEIIITVTPDVIELSPPSTVLQFDVDPNGEEIAAIVINLSSLVSGLQMINIISLDPEITTSGPLNTPPWSLASFRDTFVASRTTPFTVGTVEAEGLTSAFTLSMNVSYVNGLLEDVVLPTAEVAIVVGTTPPVPQLTVVPRLAALSPSSTVVELFIDPNGWDLEFVAVSLGWQLDQPTEEMTMSNITCTIPGCDALIRVVGGGNGFWNGGWNSGTGHSLTEPFLLGTLEIEGHISYSEVEFFGFWQTQVPELDHGFWFPEATTSLDKKTFIWVDSRITPQLLPALNWTGIALLIFAIIPCAWIWLHRRGKT